MFNLNNDGLKTVTKAPNLGIKRMRAKNLSNPEQVLRYSCNNCKCRRYNPCTCTKSAKNQQ